MRNSRRKRAEFEYTPSNAICKGRAAAFLEPVASMRGGGAGRPPLRARAHQKRRIGNLPRRQLPEHLNSTWGLRGAPYCAGPTNGVRFGHTNIRVLRHRPAFAAGLRGGLFQRPARTAPTYRFFAEFRLRQPARSADHRNERGESAAHEVGPQPEPTANQGIGRTTLPRTRATQSAQMTKSQPTATHRPMRDVLAGIFWGRPTHRHAHRSL